jgi:hypothetical protein
MTNGILILIMIVCLLLIAWLDTNDEWNKHKYK